MFVERARRSDQSVVPDSNSQQELPRAVTHTIARVQSHSNGSGGFVEADETKDRNGQKIKVSNTSASHVTG